MVPIYTHIFELVVAEDYTQDVYLAFVLFHIVRQCTEKEWCDKFFKLLYELLCNTNLPNSQLAVIYTLASQKRGEKMLLDILEVHFDQYETLVPDEKNVYLNHN